MPPLRTRRIRPQPQTSVAVIIERRRSVVANAVIAIIFFASHLLGIERPLPRPMHTSILSGSLWIDEILLGHPDRCHRELGMSAALFLLLLAELVATGDLADSRFVSAQEQVAIFVYWLVHGSSQRELQERFQRSGDTISRYLNKGLSLFATSSFYDKYVKDPVDYTPAKILEDPRWYSFFRYWQDVDTAAVRSMEFMSWPMSLSNTSLRYRDRHGAITQNVLAACDFDLLFTFVMPDYEGTAADGLLFDHARRNGFALPPGCYYLADAAFPNCDMLMTPYRGVRYHLKEWKQGNQRPVTPQNPQELFNLQHAQLRVVIERCFGVNKRRFDVLLSRPEMGYEQQALMVGAAAALHNFMRIHEPINDLDDDDDDYDLNGHPFLGEREEVEVLDMIPVVGAVEKARADVRHDRIAQAMWNVYVQDHPDLQ
ncbi:putative nuclease HARBI1-like protein [Mycena sanguinolenta]|uniref:Putative nuclease HARBI1-like protein n=1 Tax=Mycena sanguinolenta TaxID=230812 RepID=A0A8H7CML0_9AGAR|nr:putative nuclease HARBI1-like protein [Mycena sanguinolenta]